MDLLANPQKWYTSTYVHFIAKTLFANQHVLGDLHRKGVYFVSHEEFSVVSSKLVTFWNACKADLALKDVRLNESMDNQFTSALVK